MDVDSGGGRRKKKKKTKRRKRKRKKKTRRKNKKKRRNKTKRRRRKRKKKTRRKRKKGGATIHECPANTRELIWDNFEELPIYTDLFIKIKNAPRPEPIPVVYSGKTTDVDTGEWYITVTRNNTSYKLTSQQIISGYVKVCLPVSQE